jgi:hypothetical protein
MVWPQILWIRDFCGIEAGGRDRWPAPGGKHGKTLFAPARPSIALRLRAMAPRRRVAPDCLNPDQERDMADRLDINRDGFFEVEGKSYRIPPSFSPREVFSYRRLLEPIPDIPGGTELSVEQRSAQRAYLFRRAAACVIPGLEAGALDELTPGMLTTIHRWIAAHRPELTDDVRMTA